MKIMPTVLPNLNKIEWDCVSSTDTRRLFRDFKIDHPKLGELVVSSKPVNLEYGNDRIILEVYNRFKKLLGTELLFLDHNKKDIFGFNMFVEPDYRQKNLRIGEILRVFSVLEMAENKSPVFEIFSKDTAVYFHSKYKFLPNNKQFNFRDNLLEKISKDRTEGFERFLRRANELLKASRDAGSGEEQRRLTAETNGLIMTYIQKALQEKKPQITHPFSQGFNMILTKKNLEENKGFYNDLFRRYGIDYEI